MCCVGNSERQREQDFEVKVTTKSIWAYISDHRTRFINPHYQAYNKPIWPSTGVPNIVIWTHFWLRWDVSAHPNNLSGSLWHDDWYVINAYNYRTHIFFVCLRRIKPMIFVLGEEVMRRIQLKHRISLLTIMLL